MKSRFCGDRWAPLVGSGFISGPRHQPGSPPWGLDFMSSPRSRSESRLLVRAFPFPKRVVEPHIQPFCTPVLPFEQLQI